MLTRRSVISASLFFVLPASAKTPEWARKLVAAAESQIGQTVLYDPSYVKLAYPGGDVPVERGVCTDVVIRAYREGLGVDLQKLVHEDMAGNFAAYPKAWGLKRPDRNIDHRRVPNLQTFLARRNAKLAAADFAAGDLATMMLPGNLPHIGIVSETLNGAGTRPLLLHNIGAGTRREDILGTYPLTGHYRFSGA
jgi:uncharacterized protein YijF (DUF1287 family)